MNKVLKLLGVLFVFLFLFGCRAWISEKPAFHLNPNFDWQPKVKAQQLSQKSPDETIAWGDHKGFVQEETREVFLQSDDKLYKGKSFNTWVTNNPYPITQQFLKTGQKYYNINCAICHTKTGNGTKSLISKRGWVVPDITMSVTKARSEGELFDIVSNGVRSMPGYADKLDVDQRWAVVSYIRVLQLASQTDISSLTEQEKERLQ